MEGSMPHSVILQSIKTRCLNKRWEMTTIQNLGAWGSICFDQICIWSLRSLWTTTAALPWRSQWGHIPRLEVTLSARWELSPEAQSHSDLLQREAPASCYAASGISPSSSPDVLREVQDSRATLGLCPPRPGELKYVLRTWDIFGCPELQ